jgi:SAM-dependent methyltransferase
MDESLFDEMDAVAERHWWFRGRREIVLALLRRHLPPGGGLAIGDLGTGTGHMLRGLGEFGTPYGMEPSPGAARYAEARGGGEVREGALPDRVPYAPDFFDAVLLLDVLEHIPDAPGALRGAASVVKPGGLLLATVPAYPWLYCGRDRFHGHVRRYDAASLRAHLSAGGFETIFLSHFNCFLFLPAAAARLAGRLLGRDRERPDLSLPPAPVNALLERVFAAEGAWLGRGGTFPFGLSVVAVARKGWRREGGGGA